MTKKNKITRFAIKMHGIAAKENSLCETPVATSCNKRYCER